MLPRPGEQQEGQATPSPRVQVDPDCSGRTTPDTVRDGDLDELESEEEEGPRSNDEGSSEAEDADADATRPSTSGTRTNSTSSTANDAGASAMVPTKTQAAFVGKLWSMLGTPSLANLIAWTDDGKAFTVFHPTEFARTVLPQFFKHSNFASFIRQLNMYGFGKRVNDALGGSTSHIITDGAHIQAWEFQNPAFQRDRPDLLAKIRRKSAKPSTVGSSVATSRRRPSIIRGMSAKARRDLNGSDGGEDDEERAPRIGNGAQAHPSAPSAFFGDANLAQPPGMKVVAGLTEFAPHNIQQDARAQFRPRPKEEQFDGAVGSPTSHNRQHGPYSHPLPPPTGSYYHPHPPPLHSHHSPRSTMYPLAPSPFYTNSRTPLPSEDTTARQVLSLEAQVRALGEALLHTQQDYMASRAASYSILGMLLGIVADLDVGETRKDQVESCSIALSKLHPDAQVSPSIPSVLTTLNTSYLSHPPPLVSGQAHSSGHPHQTMNYQHYTKIPPVESYTRSSRPDSAISHDAQPVGAASTNLPHSFRPPSNPPSMIRPSSPVRPSTSGSSSAQPTASGLAAQHPSWGNVTLTSNRPTSLPSLSSLLEGVPANGDRRSDVIGRESEPPDDRIRKKMRQ